MLTILTLLLAEAPTGLETSTAAAAHVTALRPALPANFPGTWATSNDYPPQALHNMEQGATGYELSVAPDGRAESCVITASSGSIALDEATCRLVVDRARFSPATDAGGRAVAGSYASRVNWVLPSARAALRPGKLAFRFVVSPEGLKSGCEVVEAEGGLAARAAVGQVPCAAIPFNGRYLDDNGQGLKKRVTITQTVRVDDSRE